MAEDLLVSTIHILLARTECKLSPVLSPPHPTVRHGVSSVCTSACATLVTYNQAVTRLYSKQSHTHSSRRRRSSDRYDVLLDTPRKSDAPCRSVSSMGCHTTYTRAIVCTTRQSRIALNPSCGVSTAVAPKTHGQRVCTGCERSDFRVLPH